MKQKVLIKKIHIKDLYKKLAIYDIIYYLKQYINSPNLDELKEDILNAARLVDTI